MIYQPTEEIQRAMQAHDLRCGVEERDNASLVHVGVTTDTVSFEILFISRSDDNDVAVRIHNLIRFPEEKLDAVLEQINLCNLRYRYLKFNADTEQNTVDAEYDLPLSDEDPGESAYEILIRSASIIDACHPLLMQVLSGEEKEES